MEIKNLTPEEKLIIETSREAAAQKIIDDRKRYASNNLYDSNRAARRFKIKKRDLLDQSKAAQAFINNDLKKAPFITYSSEIKKIDPSEYDLERYGKILAEGLDPDIFESMNYTDFTFYLNVGSLKIKDYEIDYEEKNGKIRLRPPYSISESYSKKFIPSTFIQKIEEAIANEKANIQRRKDYEAYGAEIIAKYKDLKNVVKAEMQTDVRRTYTSFFVHITFKSGSFIYLDINPYSKKYYINEKRTHDAKKLDGADERINYFNSQNDD